MEGRVSKVSRALQAGRSKEILETLDHRVPKVTRGMQVVKVQEVNQENAHQYHYL